MKDYYDLDNRNILFVQNGADGTHLAVKKEDDDLTMILEFIRMGENGKDIWIRSKEADVDIHFDSFADMVRAIDKTKAKEYSPMMYVPLSNVFDKWAESNVLTDCLYKELHNAVECLRGLGKTDKYIAEALKISEVELHHIDAMYESTKSMERLNDMIKEVERTKKEADKLAEEYLNNLGFPYTTSADEQLPGYYEQAKGWIDTKNIKVDKDMYDIICAFANEEKIARIREQSEAMMKEQEDIER